MGRKNLFPNPLFLATPVVLVSCIDEAGKPNIITLAWAGVVNSEPPMVSISIRPSRYSHACIRKTKEFVINLPSEAMLRGADVCGVLSGGKVDKFALLKWKPVAAEMVKPPLIEGAPVQMECRVKEVIPLGSHDLFLGQIVAVHINEDIEKENGRIDIGKCLPVLYCPGAHEYWILGHCLGEHGFSKGKP